jgi:hypothetical protein
MKRLRFYILFILVWFLGFYNMERLIAPINLASFTYILTAFYALFVILYTPLYRISVVWTFLASLLPYLGLKVAFGSPIAGMNLPLTITEVVSIAITIYLARQIGNYMESVRTDILRLTVGPSSVAARPFSNVQAQCYREIRRARHYNRPAAVLSIAPSKESIDHSISRFLLEAQSSIIRQYIVARTADLLRTELKETDIVTMRDNHFIILLPETESKNLDKIIHRLQTSANKKLGFSLNLGASTFPEEAITFESLVENAEKRMKEPNTPGLIEISPLYPMKDEKGMEAQPNKELNKADILG